MCPPDCFTMPYTVATQPGALALLLCREERLEDPPLGCLIHSDAGVRNREPQPGSRAHSGRKRGIRAVDVEVRGPDVQPPALRHRVPRIHGEVDEDLLDLSRIGHQGPEIRGETG